MKHTKMTDIEKLAIAIHEHGQHEARNMAIEYATELDYLIKNGQGQMCSSSGIDAMRHQADPFVMLQVLADASRMEWLKGQLHELMQTLHGPYYGDWTSWKRYIAVTK